MSGTRFIDGERFRTIDPEELCAAPELSDTALADKFVAQYKDSMRYVHALKRWMLFDGERWREERTLYALDCTRDICLEAPESTKQNREARALASASTRHAVLTLARADRAIAATVEQWDTHEFILNTKGNIGCIDLLTGIGRAVDSLDYITKRTSCAVAPTGTPHPLWTAFLNRIFDSNVEIIGFLQRYLGYCLTGSVREHQFIYGYGTGANGKSVFDETVRKIMGDYACVADMNTFLWSEKERHPADIASLCGSRLVIASETQGGRHWDEQRIKALTGGDSITARFMRGNPFTFQPTFKLLVVGNHKPRLRHVDEAIRRRLIFLPFSVTIPEAERDPLLVAKLEPEHAAILRWMIDGCIEWQRHGLVVPASIRKATESYFGDQDTIGQWLEEAVNREVGPSAFTGTAELFCAWKEWCGSKNISPGSMKSFSEALEGRGLQKAQHSSTRRAGFRVTIREVR